MCSVVGFDPGSSRGSANYFKVGPGLAPPPYPHGYLSPPFHWTGTPGTRVYWVPPCLVGQQECFFTAYGGLLIVVLSSSRVEVTVLHPTTRTHDSRTNAADSR